MSKFPEELRKELKTKETVLTVWYQLHSKVCCKSIQICLKLSFSPYSN